MRSTEGTVLALIVGVAVGAALGLLFAPEKGEDTRRKIGKELDSYKNQLEDAVGDFSEVIDEGKKKLSELRDKALNKTEPKVVAPKTEA